MEPKTLSVCMIVKDEEKNIKRCLESIKDLADEIIVVDTGSSDNTVEILKEYNVKIGYFKWNKNFSDARNKSLEMATKDWILFLDADEQIPDEEIPKIKDLINNTPLEAINFRLVNIVQNNNFGDSLVLRLFKNNPNYRFVGKMHEQISLSITKISGDKSIGLSDIKILHYGYDPQSCDINSKIERNLNLLESYDENEKNGYYYYSLGNEYSRINNFEKALNSYYKAFDSSNKTSYMPYLCLNISKTLYLNKQYTKAILEIDKFAKLYPNLRDLYFLKALNAIECNKFTLAKKAILDYLNSDIDEFLYPNSNFDSLYNVAKTLTQVKKSCVNHKKGLLSALIMLNEKDDFIINTIKSLNEICDEIIIVKNNDFNIDVEPLKNLGAKIISSNSKQQDKNFILGAKKCTCKYTLLINDNEVLPLDSQKDLVDILANKSNLKFLNLITVDTKNKTQRSEFRVFKNKNLFDKINSFDEFINILKHSKIANFDTLIYRY